MQLRRVGAFSQATTITIDPTQPLDAQQLAAIRLIISASIDTIDENTSYPIPNPNQPGQQWHIQFTYPMERIPDPNLSVYQVAQNLSMAALSTYFPINGFTTEQLSAVQLLGMFTINGMGCQFSPMNDNDPTICVQIESPFNPLQLSSLESTFLYHLFALDRTQNQTTGYDAGEFFIDVNSNNVRIRFIITLTEKIIYTPSSSKPGHFNYTIVPKTTLQTGATSTAHVTSLTLSADTTRSLFNAKTKQQVAKICSPENALLVEPQKGFAGQVDREFKLSKRLPHLHMKTPTFFQGNAYFFMHRLPGVELFDFIDSNSLTLLDLLYLMRQINDAAYRQIHRNRLVHRDFKPENMLISKQQHTFQVYFFDTGLSMDENEDHFGVTVGSPGYIAPELIIPDEEVDKHIPNSITRDKKNNDYRTQLATRFGIANASIKSDIYSLGIIYAEMLGAQTWPDESILSKSALRTFALNPKLDGIFSTEPAYSANEQSNLVSLIRSMTATDPSKRPDHLSIRATIDNLILNNILPAIPKEQHVNVKVAHALAQRVHRDMCELFLPNKRIRLAELSKPIMGRLNLIVDNEACIEVFVKTLDIAALYDCRTANDVKRRIDQIVMAATSSSNALNALLEKVQTKSISDTGNTKLGAIAAYLSNRIDEYHSRYGSCFDDLIELTAKNQKLIQKIKSQLEELDPEATLSPRNE